jgi:hypothetical protein
LATERLGLLRGLGDGLVSRRGLDPVPDRPELRLDRALRVIGHLGEDVSGSVNETPLAQALAEDELDRVDEPCSAVGDDEQRRSQPPLEETPQK